MTNKNNNLVEEIQRLRDTDPAEALRRVDELDDRPTSRIAAAIVLIDCGDAMEDPESIDRGVVLLDAVVAEIGLGPETAYNLANGLQLRARYSARSDTTQGGPVADDRFRARVLFGNVLTAATATPSTISQMHTNIGLLFLETHRWVEALDSFQEAQRRMSRNAIAAFQEMRQLMHLAVIFSQDVRTYQSYCHLDALCQRVGNLARTVENNYDIVSEFAGVAALPTVRRAVERASHFEGGPDDPLSNSYFAFVRHHGLALSVLVAQTNSRRGASICCRSHPSGRRRTTATKCRRSLQC